MRISIPTFRRVQEFARLLQQLSREICGLPLEWQACVEIVILENPSEFTPDKQCIAEKVDFGRASVDLIIHSQNIGGDVNISLAYGRTCGADYNWVIGDDEQIITGALSSILAYLEQNGECGLLLLYDSSSPPSSALLAQKSWDNYPHFAAWVSDVDPFQLIAHSLISLNIVKSGVYDVDTAKFQYGTIAKRAGLVGSYAHLIAIVSGLCAQPDLQVHILPTAAVDCSQRSPHEEVVFGWADVRWLWRHYLYWLSYFLGIDYDRISDHHSMDIVFGRCENR